MWTAGRSDNVPAERLWYEQERLTDEYKDIWSDALRLDGHVDLKSSLLAEVGEYVAAPTSI